VEEEEDVIPASPPPAPSSKVTPISRSSKAKRPTSVTPEVLRNGNPFRSHPRVSITPGTADSLLSDDLDIFTNYTTPTVASANNDDDVFQRPKRLRVERSDSGHLGNVGTPAEEDVGYMSGQYGRMVLHGAHRRPSQLVSI
jgi:hypothetical protein